jgi:hypothetical protein
MRVFGVVMLAGFGLLGGLLLYTSEPTGDALRRGIGWLLVSLGSVLFASSLVAPRSLPPVYRGWMRFGEAIGGVVSALLLAVAYFLVVAPVGVVMRATSADPLERELRRDARSYWRRRSLDTTPDAYRHMS